MSLCLVPVSFRDARAYVAAWHRHHRPPPGMKYAVGAATSDGTLVGVAIVGRPVARLFDDGQTLEVTRVATDGTRNACSLLYGAAARAGFALGYTRLITYTQHGEPGASLRAAGWRTIARRPAHSGWNRPSRPRHPHRFDPIPRTLWEALPHPAATPRSRGEHRRHATTWRERVLNAASTGWHQTTLPLGPANANASDGGPPVAGAGSGRRTEQDER